MFQYDAAQGKKMCLYYKDGLICSFGDIVSKGWQQVLTQSFIFSMMSALSICRYSNVIKYTDVKSQNFRRHFKRCDNGIYMKQIILFVAIATRVSYIQIS